MKRIAVEFRRWIAVAFAIGIMSAAMCVSVHQLWAGEPPPPPSPIWCWNVGKTCQWNPYDTCLSGGECACDPGTLTCYSTHSN